jgi:hypothetical protein
VLYEDLVLKLVDFQVLRPIRPPSAG